MLKGLELLEKLALVPSRDGLSPVYSQGFYPSCPEPWRGFAHLTDLCQHRLSNMMGIKAPVEGNTPPSAYLDLAAFILAFLAADPCLPAAQKGL